MQLAPSLSNILTSNYPISENLLLNLPLHTLLNLCETNREINLLCQQDFIWRQRVNNEFPSEITHIPPNTTWRQFYVSLQSISVNIQQAVPVLHFTILRTDMNRFISSLKGHIYIIYFSDANGKVVAFIDDNKNKFLLFDPMPTIRNIYTFGFGRTTSEFGDYIYNNVSNYKRLFQYKGSQIQHMSQGVEQIVTIDDTVLKHFSQQLSDLLTNDLISRIK